MRYSPGWSRRTAAIAGARARSDGAATRGDTGGCRRSEEGRVGEEGRSRGAPYHLKKKKEIDAARTINATCSREHVAHWHGLQREMAGHREERNISDFATKLKLTDEHITTTQDWIGT